MAALLYTNKLQYSSPNMNYTARVEKFNTDSYSIRAAIGINSIEESYDLTWAGLTQAEAIALIAQLKAAKGLELLQWTPPLEASEQSFTITTFAATEYPGPVPFYSVSASLTREYDN